MISRRTKQLSPWIAVLLVIGATSVHAVDLPSGITVSTGEDGRNRVLVDVEGAELSIDGAPFQASDRARFAMATGAATGSSAPHATLLLPDGRPQPISPPAATSIGVRSGFTIGSQKMHAVILSFGRLASESDAVVWLPESRTLIAGQLCDRRGAAVSSGSDTRAWIEALDDLLDLDPAVVIPGLGAPGGPDLLKVQTQRLSELRDHVRTAVLEGRSFESATEEFDAPWFASWNQTVPSEATAAVRAVYDEIGGLTTPWQLIADRGLREGPSPTRNDPGWTRPTKILWRNSWPERLPLVKLVAPGVEIVPFNSAEEALAEIGDADALIGTASAELLRAGKDLRWVQVGSAGVERYLSIPEFGNGDVLLTNGQRLASEVIGEHVMALTRALARGLNRAVTAQNAGAWQRSEIGNSAPLTKLRGKTLLVVGLGGIGTEVARLADGAGMRVTAIRNSRRAGPPFVDKVGLGDDLEAFTREADVVVNCLPMTPDTADTFDDELFSAMKPTAFFINVGRGGTVDTDALIKALADGSIAGAGLDVTDPEPLPEGHPLWNAPNLIITPHFAAWSDEGRELRWLLYRENLRRFVAGERLLSVVDPAKGY